MRALVHHRSLRRTAVRTAAALAATVAAVIGSAPDASAQQKIKLGTAARVTLGNAPLILSKELGYFAEEGLDVELVEFLGTSVMVPQVATKAVEIGFPSADIVIISRQPGRDRLPVRFFYNAARSNIWEFAVLDKSPIQDVRELRGKKIGIGALANGNVPITRAMYKEMGMVSGKDYDFVPTGVGAPGIRALSNGDIDAFNGFDAIIAQFEVAGLKLRRLPQPEKYRGLLSNGFMAHEDTIRDNPKLIEGFGRAVTKGVVACEANIDFCVRQTWKLYPTTRPQDGTEEEKLKAGRHVLGSRMPRYLDFPAGPRRFGEYDPKVWRDYIDVLFDGGEMTSKAVDPESLYTNRFVDAFNRFDADKVRADVKDRR